MTAGEPSVSAADREIVGAQLGRAPRAIRAVAHRCPCGSPDVVETSPRLPDGTPFPTLYYLTCPRAAAAIGTLEASGMMREMSERLRDDEELAAAYQAAHESYLARREQIGHVAEIAGISAGGMPNRVKCLHVLVGHALAAGPGANPLGDEALAALPEWWVNGPCVEPMTRVAGIDCGTNSIRLLIADIQDGTLTDVVREMRVVRLGQDVDRTGRLASEAIERTRIALVDYAALARQHGADRVRMVATSATRDAANRADFVTMVQGVLGADPEVITGREEAELSFAGATSVLTDADGPLLVADIGGGSTELVRGGDGQLRSHSMDVGCVRMTERHLHSDPPTDDQVAATIADIRAAIETARADVPLEPDVTFVGVAGTVTTITAIALGLKAYDADAIHGSTVSADQVREVTDRLLHMTHAERAALPVMHPGRVDVIGAGALVLRTLVDEIGVPAVIASEHDILDGIALSIG